MISNPRHGSPPRLMVHQPTRCSTTQESSIRVHRPEPVSLAPHFEGQRWLSGGGDQDGACAFATSTLMRRAPSSARLRPTHFMSILLCCCPTQKAGSEPAAP